jgi:hypothetical protein
MKETAKYIEFENAIKQRNFEIDLFWKRSWFFGALILAEIAAFYTLKVSVNPVFEPLYLSFIIVITTLSQCLMNRGSKYWQERWEYITMNREAALGVNITQLKNYSDNDINKNYEWYYIDLSILQKDKKNFLTRSHRFSVSKITFLVWDVIFISSLLCWLNEVYSLFSIHPDWIFTIKIIVFHSIIVLYILLFFINGNVYEPFHPELFDLDDKKLKELNKEYVNNKIIVNRK